ncbi:MAG: zinc-dependent metalloprotease [Candidatus Eisenbacteria bacterium]|uniref:Zinc-dependent metalloprotease n=1 Tax=Eiseniibacteriota bacterium TaxID=2212470 RepID=A0A538U7Z8_UNCEI|nr:MAG: zinc-dependent metalloprotease [Candidatus Eisenbacteria bacterium]
MSHRSLLHGAPWLALALALTTSPAMVGAAPKPKKEKTSAASVAAAPEKIYGDWKKLTKDAEVKKGFFTLYQKHENLYAEIRPEQFDRPMLGIWSIARGIGRDYVLGGLSIFNDRLLEFHRSGDHVLVIDENTRFVAPAGSPIEKAKDLSYGNSVLASLKIESVQDSSQAVLVDLAPMLVSDIGDMAEFMRSTFNNKPVRFDPSRSAISSAKSFPENVEIEALLTYTPNDRSSLNLNTVPDDRYIGVTMHYSFSKLPDAPMMPRLADDRTGYFLQAVKDFSRDDQEHFWRRYITRWRLEKKDPGAALSEPVKPIVFYIDRTVPERYRPYVKKGVEGWQKAFEAAGFKNAIVAKDAPDDPNYDPGDVRYSTIRWITSSEPSFGAIGPSRIDPRSGEILDADILIEASIVQRRWRIYRDLIGGAGSVFESPMSRNVESALPERIRCDAAAGASVGMTLAQLALEMDGGAAPGSPIREQFIEQMLVHTVMHEVGHTLGLTHNFRASTATPMDKLNDTSWTHDKGMMGSVMDYATPNIARDRARQGDYYGDTPGTADLWMIRYGYTPSSAKNSDADYAFAKSIADESNQPGHEYSPDPDTYGPDAIDPRSNIWDLGNDPLAFAKDRAAWVADLWHNDQLEARILGPEGEYPVLRRAMDGLLEQYGIALSLGVKYIGGQYQSRNHRGQPDAHDPMAPVPAAKQKEALDFIAQRGFAADAFAISPKLLNRLAPDRWQHWGMADNFGMWTGPRLDYDLDDKAIAIQAGLLNALLAPNLLARLEEAENRSSNAFRMSDYMDRLTRALWGEVGGADAAALRALDGPNTRRDVQRAYVDRLSQMVTNPSPGLPDDARALARLQLTRIDARAARALAAKAPMGDYTRAHLLETRARIKRSLDAVRRADVTRDAAGGMGGAAVTP